MIRRVLKKLSEVVVDIAKSKYLKMMLLLCITLFSSIMLTMAIKKSHKDIVVPSYSIEQRPLTSMAFVKRTNHLEFLTCIDTDPEAPSTCQLFASPELGLELAMTSALNSQLRYSVSGSAAVISHDESRSSSYVLSAYHVCADFEKRFISIHVQFPTPHVLIYEYTPKVELLDYYGNEFKAIEVRMDRDNDICLLQTNEIMYHSPPVRVAKSNPTPGERIYNIASPHGLSRPGAVLSYEGYFAGIISNNQTIKSDHYLFAIPTAPGSSGSIVLNEQGEVISVISYGYIERPRGPVPPHDMWPNASAGPSLRSIQKLIQKRIIQ